MSPKSCEWLGSQVLILPPPAASCGFMCFLTSSPHLHWGGVTGTWRRVLSLGPRQLAQRQNFGPRPPAADPVQWPGASARGRDR